MLNYIVIAVIAYLLGNVSTSYIVAKRIANVDIRTQGSGNAGSTNVLRTLGKKAGAITFIGDVLKGAIAVWIAYLIADFSGLSLLTCGYIAAVGVVVGHDWPAFLGFRGGKGVATSLGSMLAIHPIYALICLGIFILLVYLTKYVSLGSFVSISCFPIIMLLIKENQGIVVGVIFAILVIYKHKENIKRLINKTERKIGQKKE